MTYENFKIAVAAEVMRQAGEEVEVNLHKVPKNNGVVLDAITVMKKGSHVTPTLYLGDFYEYCFSDSIEAIAAKIIELSMSCDIEKMVPQNYFVTYDSVKDHICFKLIHYEKNKEFLKTVPHKRFLDLAIVFYCIADEEFLNRATILIRNADMERWGISKEELFKKAAENTPKLLPWRFVSVQCVVEGFILEGPKEAMSVIEKASEIVPKRKDSVQMYVLTNQEKYLGAACILYPGLLASIAKKFDNDLYILPSSVHECIVMPKSKWYTKEDLSDMVQEINEREVEETEILADHVYFYDHVSNEMKL